jgi:fructoselysine/glucoselysine PTS system EIID component
MGIVTFLALQLGADVMKSFLDKIPAWVNDGLRVAGNMLPALGFALLLNMMFNKKVAPYFFLGFVLTSYLKLPVIAIGVLGVITALIITEMTHKSAISDEEVEYDTDDAILKPAPALSKKIIRSLFFRSLALEANFNFETWQNSGFAYSIIPALKKIYSNKEQMSAALKRHLQFFNTSPYGSTLIIGIIAAMEEQKSKSEDFDEESINSVKLGLMGPLAGVFDSLFWGTFKVIAAGVGISFAIKGNILGPVLFLLIFNLPHLILRYNLTFMGYNLGTKFLQNLAKTNVMDKLTLGSSILGLMMIGAMTATLMNISTPISFGTGGSVVALQNILNQIIPNIIPLSLTFLTFYFVKKNVKPTWLLLGLLLVGFLGSIIHILK